MGKVLVGMSGGVDSSVAAYLLQKAGYEVAGATLLLWPQPNTDDAADARRVCDQLGIAHYIFDMREQFRSEVVDCFAEQYAAGNTPNPCIVCNRRIKFGLFFDKAMELGFDFIATGHYAQVRKNDSAGRFELLRAVHPEKDQSYVLYPLTQDCLARLLLPLGGCTKEEVRGFAQEGKLAVAHKPDSQDICFVLDGDHGGFLARYTGRAAKQGSFVDEQGNRLGAHAGIDRYTIGQRKGLGVSLGRPAFVKSISAQTGDITLVTEEEKLFQSRIVVRDVNWVSLPPIDKPTRFEVRIRYSQRSASATATILADGGLEVIFDQPQRAPTTGQAAVLYSGESVAAGGTIAEVG